VCCNGVARKKPRTIQRHACVSLFFAASGTEKLKKQENATPYHTRVCVQFLSPVAIAQSTERLNPPLNRELFAKSE
jgi:hypothetical protein